MAMAPSITCVLIDVGGTLWPSGWVGSDVEEAGRCANLARALPALAPPRNSELSACLRTCAAEDARRAGQTLVQDVAATLRRAAQQCGLDLDPHQVQALHRALHVSPLGHLTLFPRAQDLLASIEAQGGRCVAVSNTAWRTRDDYRADFIDMGISTYVDAIITSVDVGYRKPHRAMFEAALMAGQCHPTACVMIGNSEHKDIQPAHALGIRTILVTMESPRPVTSIADAVAPSLPHVATLLRGWA